MANSQPIRIAVISENPDPNWAWIRDIIGSGFGISGRALEWRSFSTAPKAFSNEGYGPKPARGFASLARFAGARALAKTAQREPFDLIVSHGPLASAWTAALLGSAKKQSRHLAFAFNFTDLPTGLRKTLFTQALKSVDAFAVFTDAEQQLYADFFKLDRDKMLRAPWGVAPPLEILPEAQIEGPYVASLGGEARDYETLCQVAHLCPEIKFEVIARPSNFAGLSPPENLNVRFNLPFDEAWGVVGHAVVALIPPAQPRDPLRSCHPRWRHASGQSPNRHAGSRRQRLYRKRQNRPFDAPRRCSSHGKCPAPTAWRRGPRAPPGRQRQDLCCRALQRSRHHQVFQGYSRPMVGLTIRRQNACYRPSHRLSPAPSRAMVAGARLFRRNGRVQGMVP